MNLRISFFKDIINTEVKSKFDICENKVEEEYFCKLHNGAKHHWTIKNSQSWFLSQMCMKKLKFGPIAQFFLEIKTSLWIIDAV